MNPLMQMESALRTRPALESRADALGLRPYVFELVVPADGRDRHEFTRQLLGAGSFSGRLWAVLLVTASLHVRGLLQGIPPAWEPTERALIDDFIEVAARRCVMAAMAELDEGWAVDFAGALIAAFNVGSHDGANRVGHFLLAEARAAQLRDDLLDV